MLEYKFAKVLPETLIAYLKGITRALKGRETRLGSCLSGYPVKFFGKLKVLAACSAPLMPKPLCFKIRFVLF